ncbi:MAG: hypothetical protein JW770_01405 [Actinobacteria bacterium]|nr:hypothetical protein [Actinomycetota bacterium]
MKDKKENGSRRWVFPDAEMPEVSHGKMTAHESLIVLNLNLKKANIKMSLYFEDEPPLENIKLEVKPERVKCFRLDSPEEIGGIIIPRKKQYAVIIDSDLEIIAQYGRLDTTQPNMAFYTVMGYNCR